MFISWINPSLCNYYNARIIDQSLAKVRMKYLWCEFHVFDSSCFSDVIEAVGDF